MTKARDMRRWTQPEEAILHTFWRSRTHQQIANILDGRTVNAVRHRCNKLGLIYGGRRSEWSEGEVRLLTEWYTERDGKKLNLERLAEQLGRRKTTISRKARALGLSNQRRTTGRKDNRKWKGDNVAARRSIGDHMRKRIAENGHPRGMLGKHHTEEAKRRIADTQRNQAALGMHHSQLNPPTQEQCDAISRAAAARVRKGGNSYSRVKDGRRADLDNIYFRSRWEANYARFLRFRQEQGDIARWEFEPETFWFEAIKRGVRSYTPDFKIWDPGGTVYFVEVKGWMDAKSKTKLKRMKKYYPDVDLRLVGAKEYRQIERTIGTALPGWEFPGDPEPPRAA